MRRFMYNEPGPIVNNELTNVTITVSEGWIKSAFFPKWREMIINTFHVEPTLEECIEDFCVVNYAWEITNERATD